MTTKGSRHAADQELAAQVLAGSESALNRFFDQHYQRVWRFALGRLAGDRDAADDVAQQTMIQGMRRLETWRGEASLFTWLCQVARGELSTWFRRNNRDAEHLQSVAAHNPDLADSDDALARVPAPTELQPEQVSERSDSIERIHAVLDQLPSRYGDVLEWKYVDGLSVAEIATRMGTGSTAVQSMLGRARIAFREAMASRHPELVQEIVPGPPA